MKNRLKVRNYLNNELLFKEKNEKKNVGSSVL